MSLRRWKLSRAPRVKEENAENRYHLRDFVGLINNQFSCVRTLHVLHSTVPSTVLLLITVKWPTFGGCNPIFRTQICLPFFEQVRLIQLNVPHLTSRTVESVRLTLSTIDLYSR